MTSYISSALHGTHSHTQPSYRYQPSQPSKDYRDLDWSSLSKTQIAQRIFNDEIYDSFVRPEHMEGCLKALGEQEKSLVG